MWCGFCSCTSNNALFAGCIELEFYVHSLSIVLISVCFFIGLMVDNGWLFVESLHLCITIEVALLHLWRQLMQLLYPHELQWIGKAVRVKRNGQRASLLYLCCILNVGACLRISGWIGGCAVLMFAFVCFEWLSFSVSAECLPWKVTGGVFEGWISLAVMEPAAFASARCNVSCIG